MFVLCQPHSTMKGRFTGGFLKRFSELEVNNKVTGAGKLYWSSDHRDLITVCKTESVSFCLLPVCARLPTPWLWWLRFWYAGHIKWIWLWAGGNSSLLPHIQRGKLSFCFENPWLLFGDARFQLLLLLRRSFYAQSSPNWLMFFLSFWLWFRLGFQKLFVKSEPMWGVGSGF